jgi:hypothetical protein
LKGVGVRGFRHLLRGDRPLPRYSREWTELAHSDVRLNDSKKLEKIPVRARLQVLTAVLPNVM